MKTTMMPITGIVNYVIEKVRKVSAEESLTSKEKLVNYLKKEMWRFKNFYMIMDRYIVGREDEIIDGVSDRFFN